MVKWETDWYADSQRLDRIFQPLTREKLQTSYSSATESQRESPWELIFSQDFDDAG